MTAFATVHDVLDQLRKAAPTQGLEAFAYSSIAWGDLQHAIPDVEEALRLALEATADSFRLWESEGGDRLALEDHAAGTFAPGHPPGGREPRLSP